MIAHIQYTLSYRELQLVKLGPHFFAASPLLSYIRAMFRNLTLDEIKALLTASNESPRKSLSIEGYSRAAVLVPLIVAGKSLDLLFTKRTESVETHKGQISFPGGMVDAADRDVFHTALREAREEIGLTESCIEIAGMLDDMATPTGFVITPVVGVIQELPELAPNNDEVAEVFRVGLDFFSQPSNGRIELREFHGSKHEVWYYNWQNKVIWGATAMMIRSLLKKLKIA
ncbi:MAG: CoA pyrophosphatase [Bacteroidetes bacterium]|nr:CoA pyrophosphatase [Bacteroidota bacterium]MCW5896450.1 CoA pyrophosphatase [Bacteroidota bacterium]